MTDAQERSVKLANALKDAIDLLIDSIKNRNKYTEDEKEKIAFGYGVLWGKLSVSLSALDSEGS